MSNIIRGGLDAQKANEAFNPTLLLLAETANPIPNLPTKKAGKEIENKI